MSRNPDAQSAICLHDSRTDFLTDPTAVPPEAKMRLLRSGFRELHSLSCEFHEGVLTLRGTVSSYYLKQVAQRILRGTTGVIEINNRLEVAFATEARSQRPG